jgi:hypothetical protein
MPRIDIRDTFSKMVGPTQLFPNFLLPALMANWDFNGSLFIWTALTLSGADYSFLG